MEIDVTPETNADKISGVTGQTETLADKSTNGDVNKATTATNIQHATKNNNILNKKVIKHALRQQAKRRRKNTTIASGNAPSVPRIIVKPLPPQPSEEATVAPPTKTPTMREVLASIPGFNMKPRRRTNKKLSTAAQLEQTKEGCIDLETPDSILVNTNLRLLLNKATFASLPLLYQNKLAQLLPYVDRHIVTNSNEPNAMDLNNSGLNNEFFARACVEWQYRLAEGEFTPENQQKLKLEADKERSKLDPWKLKHFEPIWGDRSVADASDSVTNLAPARPPIKTTIKLRPSSMLSKNKQAAPLPVKRLRTVGAMTRSCTSLKEFESLVQPVEVKTSTSSVPSNGGIPVEAKTPIPDLLPIKSLKSQQPKDPIVSKEGDDADEDLKETEQQHDNCIVNISEAILEAKEETIILCTDVPKLEKRRRSASMEREGNSPKRKSPSPSEEIEAIAECQDEEDSLGTSEKQYPGDFENVDEVEDERKEPVEDEDSSSSNTHDSCSFQNNPLHETLAPSETVDLSELCDDVKEDTCHTDISTDSTTTEEKMEEDSPLDTISDTVTSPEFHPVCPSLSKENSNAEFIKDEETMQNSFPVLPNSLILQQESIVLEKGSCSEMCENDSCLEESAEKLEASVEESDLVMAQLSNTSFDSVQNIPVGEEDANEDRFLDAENYVLESGQITVSTQKCDKEPTEVDIEATLFGNAPSKATEDCCWSMVDSSTEKLLEVPLHALDAVPSVVTNSIVATAEDLAEDVEVIPMKEELEVRLEEGTFPVPNDWPYNVKMDSDMVAAALNCENADVDKLRQPQSYPEYTTANQVKLELEVTLTPEIVSSDSLITSTVNSSSSNPNSTVTPSVSKTITTVIPPTTIVCLPSVVSSASGLNSVVNEITQSAPPLARSGIVQSSSALPYLALSTSQPIRAVPTHSSKSKPKIAASGSGNRNRSNNKPPPGAVNLERSYQICQAVIQNSPNRDQLRCQLKPPPSLLAAVATNNAKKNEANRQTQYSSVTSSRGSGSGKTFTPPLPAPGSTYQMVQGGNGVKSVSVGQKAARTVPAYPQQRQPSPPVVVRHVFTSGQGIPVTMAVLPQSSNLSPEVVEGPNQLGGVGQYILVQRAGVADHQSIPRSSSAPPSQQQMGGAINTNSISQIVSLGANRAAGRPASVDTDHPAVHANQPSNDFLVQCPNPGTQAVTRRQRMPTGVVYGDVSVNMESPVHSYTTVGPGGENLVDHPGAAMQPQMVFQKGRNAAENGGSCACSLKAMVVCKKCGAFCHDDCIGPNKLCRTCFIR